MVGNHTHGNVLLLVYTVCSSCHISDSLQYRLEDIGIIVGGFALQSAHQTFKAHTRINYFGGKPFEAAVCLTVELHEYEVPDFDNLREST